ncbi:NADH-quinone oxidoreductase subunit L [Ekhidna sp.]|uniref:NADH-quinone oxidoreductase subunit 5 family protein n=1 Tax=Ekhidna sp. TaxID=2608089 RepID=UPI0032980503
MIIVVLFAPLVGGLAAYLLRHKGILLSVAGVAISFVVSLYLCISGGTIERSFHWLPNYPLNMLADRVALVLITLVALVSMLVHIFSLEYMKGDDGKNRYFLKLGFFTFSMIGLLLADHLILLFIFWELVGLASYLLIGFWYRKKGVPSAARMAFMVNRIADVALLAGILLLSNNILNISEFKSVWLFLPSILIAIGAFGKSAQLPFSGWLTKAMVGPTPVSALIHAATMVAAGVYLLFRVSPFIHPSALMVVALVGTFTALYGGVCALMQHDLKKILAYSTVSQLGYMVMGIGVGAQTASLFHLFTHAFFKAGLFLGAGAIIHFMHQATKEDTQDMRKMGGLRKQLPWTYLTFIMCAMALAGIPLFSGFMSKEGIIIAGWIWASNIGTWAYLVPDIALITVFLTALYVGRMVMLVFWGENRVKDLISKFSETFTLKIPLIVLSVGSLWFFYNWNPIAHVTWFDSFLGNEAIPSSDIVSLMVTFLSLLMTATGLVLGFSFFKPNSAYSQSYVHMADNRFPILLNGFHLTSLYQLFGIGIERLSVLTFQMDRKVVDGAVHLAGIGGVVISKVFALVDRFIIDGPINLIGYISGVTGKLLASFSARDIQTQFAWLLVGIILILSWILFF